MYSAAIHALPMEGSPLDGTIISGDACLVLTTDPKPRLRWTAELHDRFVDAVTQLGGPDSTWRSCLYLKSFCSKVGSIFRLHGSANKYERLDAKLEKKLAEARRSPTDRRNFKSINSIILRFPHLREGLRGIRAIFEQHDVDGNGTIDLEELKKCLRQMHLHLKEEEVEDLYGACDFGGSPGIQFNEFIVLLCLVYLLAEPSSPQQSSSKISPELDAIFETTVEAFHFLDKNGDGKLNKKDVINAINDDSPSEKSPAHVTKSRFREMDWDKNGTVTFREFLFALINWVGMDADDEPLGLDI